jgi:hypothetical protein
MKRTFIVAMVVVFVMLSITFIALGIYASQFQTISLHIANLIMFGLSLGAYVLVNKKIAERPQAFVQGVYSASLLKLMVCMGAMLGYVMLHKDKLHKPTVFALLGVYAVYSATETILLSKSARAINNTKADTPT